MFLSIMSGFNLLGLRRRNSAPVNELDVIFAKAQNGLEKKRRQWLIFLIEREEHCQNLLLQSDEYTTDDESKISTDSYGNSMEAMSAAEQRSVPAPVRDKKRVKGVSSGS